MKLSTILKNNIPLCFAALMVAIPAAGQHSSENVFLAVVNNDSIKAWQLETELVRIHSGQEGTSRGHFDVQKVLDRLVNERLMIQDARFMKLDQEPGLRKEVEDYRQACALEQYVSDAIPDTFPIDEQEIQAYYGENYRRLHLFLLKLRDRQQADNAALFLAGAKSLSDIAPRFPSESYRFGSGDQGFKVWSQLDLVLQQKVKGLLVGQITGPFEHASGYSFAELLGEQPADTAWLEQHRPRIRALLNQQRKRQFREDLVQSLKGKYPVMIDDSLLQQYLNSPDSIFQQPELQSLEIAKAGDNSISLRMLQRRLGHGAGRTTPDQRKNRIRESLNNIIEDRLFAQEASALDYAQNPRVLKNVEAFEDSLLLYGYLEQVVTPQVSISEAALDSFYQADSEMFRHPDDVLLGQITVGVADRAAQILNRLQGGADFVWLVREFSTDEYAVKDGDRGWFNLGTLPPMMRADLDTARIGQYLGPYREEEGFIIYRLNDRRQGELPELAKVQGRVHKILYQREFDRVLNEVLAELKEGATIIMNREAIRELVIGGTKE
ncbi:MAG TPA: peptidyl-prolyl cis-trans isomerase [bacterium]|jgi:parvulin-like peptidyl-prolyl isomerase